MPNIISYLQTAGCIPQNNLVIPSCRIQTISIFILNDGPHPLTVDWRNGYARNTTPGLARRNLVNFGAISACGTATAISVPCLLSHLTKDTYDEAIAKGSDNLLDVLQRAGIKVLWRDNNSGCKKMCDRVEQDQSFAQDCLAGECQDSALLNGLRQKIMTSAPAATPLAMSATPAPSGQ